MNIHFKDENKEYVVRNEIAINSDGKNTTQVIQFTGNIVPYSLFAHNVLLCDDILSSVHFVTIHFTLFSKRKYICRSVWMLSNIKDKYL